MSIPKEAISLANFKRQERGLPPKQEPKRVREDPIPPKVADQIAFDDLPTGEIFDFNARRRHPTIKNKDGVMFTGFDIFLETRDGEISQGWLPEGAFQKLKQRIQIERPDLLTKIGI